MKEKIPLNNEKISGKQALQQKFHPMHKAFHLSADINSQYMWRNDERKGLTSVDDSVHVSIQGLDVYIKKYKEILITVTNNRSSNIYVDRKTTKTIIWIFQVTKCRDCTWEYMWTWLKEKSQERNCNSSKSSTKQSLVEMLKRKSIIRNGIASLGYAEKEIKWLVTIVNESNILVQKDYKTRHAWWER